MKHSLFIMLLLLTHAISVEAQIRITTSFSERITGYKTDENDSLLSIRCIEGGDYVIKKENIRLMDSLTSEIVTTTGERYLGNIFLLNSNGIEFINMDGSVIQLAKSEIQKYSLSSRLYGSGYISLGITFLGPGGINIICSGQFENTYFFRIEYGNSFDDYKYGYQFNLGYNLVREKYMEQNISFGAGVTFERKKHETAGYKSTIMKDTKYFGIFYDVNFYGFFFEAGALLGNGINNGLGASFQAGYVYRFL